MEFGIINYEILFLQFGFSTIYGRLNPIRCEILYFFSILQFCSDISFGHGTQ